MAANRKPGNPWNQFPKKPKPKPSKPPRVPASKALPPGAKGGAVTKAGTKPPAGGTKALPPGQRGGALATRPTASPAKPQPKPSAPRGGAIEKAGPTIDVKANTPKVTAGKPTVRTGQPGPNRAALPAAKPPAKPSLRGALRGSVGRGNAAIIGLSAANAIQDAVLTPQQRATKEKNSIKPLTVQEITNSIRGKGVRTGTASGRTGKGGTTADVRATAPAKPRVSNIPPAEGTGRGGPSDVKRTQPKPPTRSSGGNPTTPGSSRRQPNSGGGSGASSRPSSPQASSGTASKGQQLADFNPNRGTSQTNNPLIKNDSWLTQRMKDREDSQQAKDSMKVGNKFDVKSDIYTPSTKVDGSGLDTKKINKKKVNEYDRRKRRYYD